jgi:hypothetical protein
MSGRSRNGLCPTCDPRLIADTPTHPEYPCAHCITSSAVGAVLKSAFGNNVLEFSTISPTAPVTRRWMRIQDYTDEISSARIFAGIHHRFSTSVGEEMGRRIGELVVKTHPGGVKASAKPHR